ncbi:hypothetical protein AB2L28_06035 [Kineococcus sp. TBRC 1896]|uniref:Glycosyltransferase involved in cell wall biosynthesis n=1 Tax=Kineococcus mangrovi TaxID=1660183 RepID=A0ABV4HZF1_9ACTN
MSPSPARAVVQLVVGPAEHGVAAAALAQWDVLRHEVGTHLVRAPARPGADGLAAALAGAPAGVVHVHVTDRLLGRSPEEAADVLVALAAGRDLVVSLHDLPQVSDGARNLPRRSAAYRRVAQAARHVVVASRHEERLLRACGADVACTVVPLPVPDLTGTPAAAPGTPLRTVAVLGYLYPGKGHEQVLAALDALPPGVGLTAVGRPSDGHEDLLASLAAQARAVGRTCEVTGYVPDADLPALLRSPVLPVAPHEHLSASGSINAWTGAGRRPLVPRSDYVTELEDRSPGALLVYEPGGLADALARAWAQPDLTWARPGTAPGPTVADTVALLRPVLAGVPA